MTSYPSDLQLRSDLNLKFHCFIYKLVIRLNLIGLAMNDNKQLPYKGLLNHIWMMVGNYTLLSCSLIR